jgi:hypothetical protein
MCVIPVGLQPRQAFSKPILQRILWYVAGGVRR